MKKQAKEFIGIAAVPLVVLAIFALLFPVWRVFDLPTYPEMNALARNAFEMYGLPVIFIGALAEGLLFFNWYLPGSVVVVMGGVFAAEKGIPSVIMTVAVISLGFWLTGIINYALGRYGWYKVLLKFGLRDAIEKTRRRTEKHGLKILFGTSFHPNVGALTATSAGILRLSFVEFALMSALALAAWNTLWGTIVYWVGPPIIGIVNYKNLLLILGGWVAGLLVYFVWVKLRQPKIAAEPIPVTPEE